MTIAARPTTLDTLFEPLLSVDDISVIVDERIDKLCLKFALMFGAMDREKMRKLIERPEPDEFDNSREILTEQEDLFRSIADIFSIIHRRFILASDDILVRSGAGSAFPAKPDPWLSAVSEYEGEWERFEATPEDDDGALDAACDVAWEAMERMAETPAPDLAAVRYKLGVLWGGPKDDIAPRHLQRAQADLILADLDRLIGGARSC